MRHVRSTRARWGALALVLAAAAACSTSRTDLATAEDPPIGVSRAALETATWTKSLVTTTHGGVNGHKMVYDAERQRVVMFGGDLFYQTLLWDGTQWSLPALTLDPVTRFGHAMVWDSLHKVVLMMGGQHGNTLLNDAWTWNGTAWTAVASPGHVNQAALAFDAAHGLVVFYGLLDLPSYPPATMTFDGTTWTTVANAQGPGTRYAHAMMYDAARSKIVLFGGLTSTNKPDDQTWLWDGTTWTQAHPATSPSARSGNALVYDDVRRVIILVGGLDGNGNFLNDTWSWNGTTWTDITGISNLPTREGFAMAFDSAQKQGVFLGGESTTGLVHDDTWFFSQHGGGCTAGTECSSGSCVDGACCDTANCGSCETCNGGTPGTCAPVVNAPDTDSCPGVCDSAGVCKTSGGQACTAPADCATGFCVDGVCCDGACPGQCEACNLAEAPGRCNAVRGTPRSSRPSCAVTEAGGGACAVLACDGVVSDHCTGLAGPDVICRPGSCTNGTASLPSGCDGRGTCEDVVTTTCAPYVCAGAICGTSCASDAECDPKFTCNVASKTCTPRSDSTCDTDGHTLVAPDGARKDCAPYVCKDGACGTKCATVSDCSSPNECTAATFTCVPPPDPQASSDGGCATAPGEGGTAGKGWALALLLLLLARRRRSAGDNAESPDE